AEGERWARRHFGGGGAEQKNQKKKKKTDPPGGGGPGAGVTSPPWGSGAPEMAARSRDRSVIWAPGTARCTVLMSAAVSSRGPVIAITVGCGARFPRAQRGTTASWLPAGTPARPATPPAMWS